MGKEKQLKDLEDAKQNQEQQQMSYTPPSEQAPLDLLAQQLDSLEQDVRKQQLETETSLQGSFSQVANGLGDAQAAKQLQQVIASLNDIVSTQGLQGAPSQYYEHFSQLERDLQQQLQSGSQQVVQSLQQSVSALAQANAALMDSQSYHQMLHYVDQARLMLLNWEAKGEATIH